jgi:hypothetical protein
VSENIFESEQEGRLRLLEDVENDLLELTVKRWRQKANNKE